MMLPQRAVFELRVSFQKLKCPFRKSNNGQFALPYIHLTLCNKSSDTLKHTSNLKDTLMNT